MKRARPIDVTVVLLDGGYASTAIGPLEVFHSAGLLWNWLKGEPHEPRFRVRVASPGGRMVKSLCNLGIKPECALEDVRRTDIVVISASGWDLQEKIMRHTAIISWLKKMHDQGAYLAAVCSGAAYVAETGLMDGREATTHWGVVDAFRERYPNVRWRPEHFVTEDGRICCSGGVYASIDISLYLVEKFCGHDIALKCAKALLVGLPRTSQSGYSIVPISRPHADTRIRKAEEIAIKLLHGPVEAETREALAVALAEEFTDLSLSVHPGPEVGIVVPPAAHVPYPRHDVLRLQRIVRVEPGPEDVLHFPRQAKQRVRSAARPRLRCGFHDRLELRIGEEGDHRRDVHVDGNARSGEFLDRLEPPLRRRRARLEVPRDFMV